MSLIDKDSLLEWADASLKEELRKKDSVILEKDSVIQTKDKIIELLAEKAGVPLDKIESELLDASFSKK
jgi:hypothetical protein